MMKKILYIIPLLLALLTACQKEELGGKNDPDAVRINATIGEANLLSRTAPTAPADDDKWQDRDLIAVSNGDNPVVYTYNNGTWKAIGDDYLKWTNSTMAFTAYHPVGEGVSATDFTLPTDQSTTAKIATADYMTFAGGKTRPEGSCAVNLELARKTARIILSVTFSSEFNEQHPIISNVKINSAYSGYADGTGTGSVTPVTPCLSESSKRYALVIPTAVAAGKTFITLTVTYTGGTKDLTLTGIPTLTAGNSYTISLTAGKEKLTMGGITVGEWTGSDIENVTSKELASGFSTSDLKIGDYYYSDGTWSDGGYRKYADLSSDVLNIRPVLTGASGKERTVLGIVMKVGKDISGDWVDDCAYKTKGGSTMSTIQGYVLALYDANGESGCTWGSFGTKVGTSQQGTTGFYGYKDMQKIKAMNGYGQTTFPAAYWASSDYETRENGKYASPAGSSGWFLPSAGQCQYWLGNKDLLLKQVRKATGDAAYEWKDYWSSSEGNDDPAINAWCHFPENMMWISKQNVRYVRSCLAF